MNYTCKPQHPIAKKTHFKIFSTFGSPAMKIDMKPQLDFSLQHKIEQVNSFVLFVQFCLQLHKKKTNCEECFKLSNKQSLT